MVGSLSLAFTWRHLLFANWRVDPDVVDAHLPAALSVETYDGDAWLSVVPFINADTRPRGLPAVLGVDLPELNLRTYVTHGDAAGVYFFSLDADGLLSVIGARLTHHLPYFFARARLTVGREAIRYRSRRRHPGARPARFAATYRPRGEAFTPAPGSIADFLTERRRLYTQGLDGSIRHTDVEHPPWTLYPAELAVGENTLFEANGFAHPGGEPVCYYSPGVDVVTGTSRRAAGTDRPSIDRLPRRG